MSTLTQDPSRRRLAMKCFLLSANVADSKRWGKKKISYFRANAADIIREVGATEHIPEERINETLKQTRNNHGLTTEKVSEVFFDVGVQLIMEPSPEDASGE